jgi:perosamine synthetase
MVFPVKRARRMPIAKPEISPVDREYMIEAIDSGWVSSLGKYIELAEGLLTEFAGKQFCVTTSNGTTALHLALAVLDLPAGSKVLFPDCTFAAVSNAIIQQGLIPVPVGVHLADWQLNADLVEEHLKRGENVSAVIGVHTYGVPCDAERMLALCRKYGVYLIEDCAEAHEAKIGDRKVGSFGDISCFSFFANKQVVSGEGGALCTNNPEWAYKARVLKAHGMSPAQKYEHIYPGFNYRMTNIAAALLYSQLLRRSDVAKRRVHIFAQYLAGLSHDCEFQEVREGNSRVNWLTALLMPDKSSRDRVQKALEEFGVETRKMFQPISSFGYMKKYECGICESSQMIHGRGIVLPLYNEMTVEDIDYVVRVVNASL